jgi:type I restriction-modification system DNA methylase subunit
MCGSRPNRKVYQGRKAWEDVRQATNNKKNGTSGNLGFEATLWATADKLRGHMDASEYKHVVLGLIFLKYISDAFQEKYDALAATQKSDYTDPEDRDEYLWVVEDLNLRPLRCQGPS